MKTKILKVAGWQNGVEVEGHIFEWMVRSYGSIGSRNAHCCGCNCSYCVRHGVDFPEASAIGGGRTFCQHVSEQDGTVVNWISLQNLSERMPCSVIEVVVGVVKLGKECESHRLAMRNFSTKLTCLVL